MCDWIVRNAVGLLVALLYGAQASFAQEPTTDLGDLLKTTEIAPYSITIFPDGTNLPDGQGTARQGAILYADQCASCHGKSGVSGPAARLIGNDGWFAINDPFRVLRIRKYPVLLISVTGMWPHATTIFDYIRRAMPHHSPKSLTDEEVYDLTAYLLYLDNLAGYDAVLDKKSILAVKMPGLARSISDWAE